MKDEPPGNWWGPPVNTMMPFRSVAISQTPPPGHVAAWIPIQSVLQNPPPPPPPARRVKSPVTPEDVFQRHEASRRHETGSRADSRSRRTSGNHSRADTSREYVHSRRTRSPTRSRPSFSRNRRRLSSRSFSRRRYSRDRSYPTSRDRRQRAPDPRGHSRDRRHRSPNPRSHSRDRRRSRARSRARSPIHRSRTSPARTSHRPILVTHQNAPRSPPRPPNRKDLAPRAQAGQGVFNEVPAQHRPANQIRPPPPRSSAKQMAEMRQFVEYSNMEESLKSRVIKLFEYSDVGSQHIEVNIPPERVTIDAGSKQTVWRIALRNVKQATPMAFDKRHYNLRWFHATTPEGAVGILRSMRVEAMPEKTGGSGKHGFYARAFLIDDSSDEYNHTSWMSSFIEHGPAPRIQLTQFSKE